MKKVEIISLVENGRLKSNRGVISRVIEQFNGKEISITIKLNRKRRSGKQNSYYWAVIVPIWKDILYNEWGEFYSSADTHEFLKYNCNYQEKVNEGTGEVIRVSKSTQSNTTTDQELFHEHARKLAYDMFDAVIPLPNEQLTIE